MKSNQTAIFFAVLAIAGAMYAHAAPSFDDEQEDGQKFYDVANRAEKVIQKLSEMTDSRDILSGMEEHMKSSILAKMDQLFHKTAEKLEKMYAQEGDQNINAIQTQPEDDMEEQLKEVMLTKMKEMYGKAMRGDMSDIVDDQKPPQLQHSKPRSEMEELVDYYLSKKVKELQTKEEHFNGDKDEGKDAAASEYEAHII